MKKLLIICFLFLFSCGHQPVLLPPMPVKKIKILEQDVKLRESVRNAVRPFFSFFRDCYTNEYSKDKYLNGEMFFTWEIHGQGEANTIFANPTPTSLKNPILEQCLIEVISRVRFPAPPVNTVWVVENYLFVFKGEGDRTWTETTY